MCRSSERRYRQRRRTKTRRSAGASSHRSRRQVSVMPSARKIAANRLNGRKSRGPRTLAGKTQTSQNAKVHGLSGSIQHDQTVLVQIAKAICGENKNPVVFERAL